MKHTMYVVEFGEDHDAAAAFAAFVDGGLDQNMVYVDDDDGNETVQADSSVVWCLEEFVQAFKRRSA